MRVTYKNVDLDFWENVVFFIVKPVFILFLYFGMFNRYSGFGGLSGGMTAVILSALLFFFSVFHLVFVAENKKMSQLTVYISAFIIMIAILPLASGIVFNERPDFILRYAVEMIAVFFMFYSVYYLISSKIISPRFLIGSFAILGFIAAMQLLISIWGVAGISRLRGLAGLNYIGQSFALSATAWVMMTYKGFAFQGESIKASIYFLAFMIVFLALLLTGTRAAAIGFLAGLVLLQLLGIRNKRFNRFMFAGSLIMILTVLILAMNIDMSMLFARYDIDNIAYMADKRFGIYTSSVTDLTLPELLLGRPDLYTFEDGLLNSERFINTHNIFLSMIRYNGILAFIFFVFLLMILIYQYFMVFELHKKVKEFSLTESSIFIFLFITLIYAVLSGGRTTRIFYFFIVLGYVAGYFELLKTVRSTKEYKTLIL